MCLFHVIKACYFVILLYKTFILLLKLHDWIFKDRVAHDCTSLTIVSNWMLRFFKMLFSSWICPGAAMMSEPEPVLGDFQNWNFPWDSRLWSDKLCSDVKGAVRSTEYLKLIIFVELSEFVMIFFIYSFKMTFIVIFIVTDTTIQPLYLIEVKVISLMWLDFITIWFIFLSRLWWCWELNPRPRLVDQIMSIWRSLPYQRDSLYIRVHKDFRLFSGTLSQHVIAAQ